MLLKHLISFTLASLLIYEVCMARAAKVKRYSYPLMRTRRGLRDIRGVPTENLKGRPGQGYYIAVEVGTPSQRVS